MNSNTVLNKILTLLSLESKDVKFTYAKLVDGTIVESPTFDVGEPIEVVTEEGKSPAPDGEHELFLKDEEGNEVRIRVITKDGIITERMNVEEEAEEPTETPAEETELQEEEVTEENKDATEISLEEVDKRIQEMAYRIEELEKKIASMELIEKDEEVEEMEEEEELPKLDGAPVTASKVSLSKTKLGNKAMDRQSAFLAKLYN
jgi:hypothetical protein